MQYSGYIFYSLYIIVPAGLFRPGPSNAEHVDCPFDHAYHIIQPFKNILIPKKIPKKIQQKVLLGVPEESPFLGYVFPSILGLLIFQSKLQPLENKYIIN